MANPATAIPLIPLSSSSSSSKADDIEASAVSRTRLLSNSSSRGAAGGGGGLKHIDEEDEEQQLDEEKIIDEPPQHYGSIAERLEHLFFHHDEIFSFSNCTKSKIIDLSVTLVCLLTLILVLIYFALMTRAPDEYKFDNEIISKANLMPNDEFTQLKRQVIRLCGTVENYNNQNRDIICFDEKNKNCTSLSKLFNSKLYQCQIETDRRTQHYDKIFPNYERNIFIARMTTVILAFIIFGLCIIVFVTHGKTDIFRRPSKRIYNLPRNKLERGCFVFIFAAFAICTIIIFLGLSLYIPRECYSMSFETCKNQYPGYHG